IVQRMLAAHMSLIPTLTLFDVEMQKGGASPEATEGLIQLATGQLRMYSAAGGQILFGTDIGYIDHYDTAEEFTLMSRAGMTFQQILTSLTTAPASRFGYSHTAVSQPTWTPTLPSSKPTRPRTLPRFRMLPTRFAEGRSSTPRPPSTSVKINKLWPKLSTAPSAKNSFHWTLPTFPSAPIAAA